MTLGSELRWQRGVALLSVRALAAAAAAMACRASGQVDAHPTRPAEATVTLRPRRMPMPAPLREPRVDSRSADELADSACIDSQGQWACRARKRKTLRAAGGAAPWVPVSWTLPAWNIDPANVSGCASDANSGTSGTCGAAGIGPLLSYSELAKHRWGTYSPRLQQPTTVTFQSSHVGTADVVYVDANLEGGSLTLTGALTAVCSGTVANLSARTTASLTKASIGSCTPTNSLLAVNSTHSSRAWPYSVSSGSIWNFTQPQRPVTPNWNGVDPHEAAWSNGDAVTLYAVPTILVGELRALVPVYVTLGQGLYVTQLNIASISAAPLLTRLSGLAYLIDVRITAAASIDLISDGIEPYYFNVNAIGDAPTILAGNSPADNIVWQGGAYTTPAATGASATFQGGVIVGGGATIVGHNASLFDVYLDTATTFDTLGDSVIATFGFAEGPSYAVSGPGTLNVVEGKLSYPSGAGQAAALLQMGALKIGSQSAACLSIPTATSTTMTCNLAATPAALDANLGATSGCFFGAGGHMCNTGYL